MSRLSEAFTRLLDANDRALGTPQTVTINGAAPIRAIIEDLTTDELLLAGGTGDSGGFRVMVAVADLPVLPEKGDPITARGQTFEVLSFINRNNVTYELTAGLTVTEDAR